MQTLRWARPVALAVVLCAAALAPRGVDAQNRWGAAYFPNITLTTHQGQPVQFYDLIKGKIVAIELMYTSCQYNCPLETARLAQVARLLGPRMGKDVFFYSITIDPERDTPQVLSAYAKQYSAGPGWLFLTGKPDELETLRKKLGLYSRPNPDNKDGHMPELLIGNEATGQWTRESGLDNPQFVAQMIGNWMNSWQTTPPPVKSYAEAAPLARPGRGQYLYSTKCVTCHTVGQGDRIGPDLAGVLAQRDRAWLTRYISSPDVMRSAGDPIARTLLAKYPARMPNLNLSAQEAAEVVAYVASQVPRRGGGQAQVRRGR